MWLPVVVVYYMYVYLHAKILNVTHPNPCNAYFMKFINNNFFLAVLNFIHRIINLISRESLIVHIV